VPDYKNSTVHPLETGLDFRKHPADTDYFLHGHRNIYSSLRNYSEDYLLTIFPPHKISQQHIFIPNISAVGSGCIYG